MICATATRAIYLRKSDGEVSVLIGQYHNRETAVAGLLRRAFETHQKDDLMCLSVDIDGDVELGCIQTASGATYSLRVEDDHGDFQF